MQQNRTPPDLAILLSARETLADPKRWMQGSIARTDRGLIVAANHPQAAQWSLFGALQRANLDLREPSVPVERPWMEGKEPVRRPIIAIVLGLLQPALSKRGFDRLDAVWEFNADPSTKHADVLGVLDEVIESVQTMHAPVPARTVHAPAEPALAA